MQRRERGRSIAVWVQNGLAVVLGFIAGVWNFCRGLSGMSLVGKVESLWRYPIKSSAGGEGREEAFVWFSGVYGDRLFAFKSSAAPKGFPYLTGREQEEMLLYRPRFRHPERAAKPPNLSEAEGMVPGINPVFAEDRLVATFSAGHLHSYPAVVRMPSTPPPAARRGRDNAPSFAGEPSCIPDRDRSWAWAPDPSVRKNQCLARAL